MAIAYKGFFTSDFNTILPLMLIFHVAFPSLTTFHSYLDQKVLHFVFIMQYVFNTALKACGSASCVKILLCSVLHLQKKYYLNLNLQINIHMLLGRAERGGAGGFVGGLGGCRGRA